MNLVLDQDNNFYLISLNILITCLLNNVWIWWEKLHVNLYKELKRLETLGTMGFE